MVKNLPDNARNMGFIPGRVDPLEKEMASHDFIITTSPLSSKNLPKGVEGGVVGKAAETQPCLSFHMRASVRLITLRMR